MAAEALFPLLAAWLWQATLAVTVAIVGVQALRLPLRRAFGARIAYAAWWLLPACLLAPLLPVPARAPRMFEIAADAGAALPALVASAGAGADGGMDLRAWLLAAWVAGAIGTVFVFARRQRAFGQGIRRLPGQPFDLIARHGPAVAGLLRPRILLPEDFDARYTAQEQALVLAHERLHLARGDILAQAAASALRCVFWFHPLVHLAAAAFRFDQELACDADVLARFPASRRAYGGAMLKTQLAEAGLPIGCHWQSNHPLKERLTMLKQQTPGGLRRNAGRALVALVLGFGAYAAWAARPATPAPDAARISLEFEIAADGAAPVTPKVVVLENEGFSLHLGTNERKPPGSGEGLDIEMVAKRQGSGRIHLSGTLRRDGGEPKQADLVLVDGASSAMARLEMPGVVLQVRGHTMAADEPMPSAGAPKVPQLAKLTSADDMSPPAYPKAALAAGTPGKVGLLVYIDANGRVTDARVESAEPAGMFEEAALAAARKWHFSEAARDTNGKRPQGWMRTEVEFRPDGAPQG